MPLICVAFRSQVYGNIATLISRLPASPPGGEQGQLARIRELQEASNILQQELVAEQQVCG